MQTLLGYIRRLLRAIERKRLKNKDFSLVTNNCIGGVISHDMHLQFRSPTVNLCFENEQFIIFCEHLEYYCSLPVTEVTDSGRNYPVGKLIGQYGEVKLFFMHYSSFDEARRKWEERVNRMDYSNLFILMESRPECPMSLLSRFDKLPYNKAVLTCGPVASINSSFPIRSSFYSKDYHNGKILEYHRWGFRRFYERFDYVLFFNTGLIRKRYV